MSALANSNQNFKPDLSQNNLPREAKNLLQVLDNLEDFTIKIRKKLSEEIKSSSELIHIKIDSV